jgi:hypothetical protein
MAVEVDGSGKLAERCVCTGQCLVVWMAVEVLAELRVGFAKVKVLWCLHGAVLGSVDVSGGASRAEGRLSCQWRC